MAALIPGPCTEHPQAASVMWSPELSETDQPPPRLPRASAHTCLCPATWAFFLPQVFLLCPQPARLVPSPGCSLPQPPLPSPYPQVTSPFPACSILHTTVSGDGSGGKQQLWPFPSHAGTSPEPTSSHSPSMTHLLWTTPGAGTEAEQMRPGARSKRLFSLPFLLVLPPGTLQG